jgi:hypothetical protein
MTSPELEALARTGALKREAPSRAEYDSLVRSGEERLGGCGSKRPGRLEPLRPCSTTPHTLWPLLRSGDLASARRAVAL